MPNAIVNKFQSKWRSLQERANHYAANRKVDRAKTDPRITYPCYKSMDQFIDVERLKALDGYITERLHRQARKDELFHTGPLTLGADAEKLPGSRMVLLSHSTRPFQYLDLDKPELWKLSPEAAEFPLLMDFIATLPFKATARMMIMYDNGGKPVTAHRDHSWMDVCHEFIWFRTNLNKPFYVLNHKTKEKLYVKSHSAWFDSVNQFHGADSHENLSVSIRVDGIFSDELRKQIQTPSYNPSSTPAYWACLDR